jgi:polyadenylate-binding protein
VTNIVIKNLPEGMDGTALKEIFGKFGKIVSIKVPLNEDGQHRGYAYMMFEKEEAARLATEELNGAVSVGDGASMQVERYKNPAAVREEAMKLFTNLYVKNLAPGVTDAQLEAAYVKFGKVTSAKVRSDETGRSMGFGFVAFEDHEAAIEALDATNEKESDLAAEGQVLSVKRFMDKKERSRAREVAYRERQAQYAKYPNLYVKNFDDNVTEQQLKELFEQFGETVSVRIQHDPFTKMSRGFGFVSFKDHNSAEKAVRELAGSRVLGVRPLFVTYAMRRDARRQQYEEMQKKRPGMGMPRPMGMGGPMGMGMGMGPMAGPMGGQQNPMFGGMQGQQFRMVPPGPMGMGGMQGMMMRPGMAGGVAGGMGMPGGMPPGMGMPGQNQMMMPNQMLMQRPIAQPARPMPMQQPKPAAAMHPSGLDANYLASMSPEQQKNVLGERLYTYIVKKFPKQAAKITGMLLEMDNSEILNLLDSPLLLDSKMNEAMEVLEKHDSRM